MSILIKGMEMPQHGDVLVVREYNGKTYIQHKGHCGFEGRLIELPPHGRLIAEKTITEIRYHDADGYHIVNGEQLCELEIDAPTVIEAEGETDGR